MKTKLIITVAALAMSASVAFALTPAESVVSQLQAQGYTHIEVSFSASQMKVEAIRGGAKLEVIYDRTTNAILKQEVRPVSASDDTSAGVEYANSNNDFLDYSGDDSDDDDWNDDDDDDSDDDDNEDDSDDDSNDDSDDDD